MFNEKLAQAILRSSANGKLWITHTKHQQDYLYIRLVTLVDDTKEYPLLVEYQGLDGTTYVQPWERFIGKTEVDGEQVWRFKPKAG